MSLGDSLSSAQANPYDGATRTPDPGGKHDILQSLSRPSGLPLDPTGVRLNDSSRLNSTGQNSDSNTTQTDIRPDQRDGHHPSSSKLDCVPARIDPAVAPGRQNTLPPLPTIPARPHTRALSAGLQLQTDFSTPPPKVRSKSPTTPTIVESKAAALPPASASNASTVTGRGLRRALSAASMTNSLSPGSALSSPALGALADITPLPSPLVLGDSPGPWKRAAVRRSDSRGSAGDRHAADSLSPPSSVQRKGYQGLMPPPLADGAAAHGRNRSLSEYVPEALLNVRPRHVTVSDAPAAPGGGQSPLEPHMHREQYLAAQRGLTHPRAAETDLPTPPPSNRSATESEEEELKDEAAPPIPYITVHHGPDGAKQKYRPLRELGQGTFSKVILATRERLPAAAGGAVDESRLDPRKLVAIKVVEHGPAGGADEERVELSLKREVEIMKSISHPSLVHLKAFDCDEDKALLLLQYCPGGDLFELASSSSDLLAPAVVRRIFSELVSAVRYLHDLFIVHRDIKLENVLLNVPAATLPSMADAAAHPYPLVTLTDLGLSKRIPPPPASPLLTTRCGSEDYAAPEILLGQPYDGRLTDAWALGVLLYALMENTLPFDPPPGAAGRRGRSRTAHRIARCEWGWWRFGDHDGAWDERKGEGWGGGRECVESLLKKATRGRKGLAELSTWDWVKNGVNVPGGLRKSPLDEDADGVGEVDPGR